MFKNLKKKIEESGEFVAHAPIDPIFEDDIMSKSTTSIESEQKSKPPLDLSKFSTFGDDIDVMPCTPTEIKVTPSFKASPLTLPSSNFSLSFLTPKSPQFMPQSDIESECGSELGEEVAIQDILDIDVFSKEQLFYKVKRVLTQLTKYRGRYSEVTHAYKVLEREREKMQNALLQFQDKTLRRMNEMKEAAQLDQQAKAHMEHSFRLLLEEKEDVIKALRTQNQCLKENSIRDACPDVSVQSNADIYQPTNLNSVGAAEIDAAFDTFVTSERVLKGEDTYESEVVSLAPLLTTASNDARDATAEALENALEQLRLTHARLMELEKKSNKYTVTTSIQTDPLLEDPIETEIAEDDAEAELPDESLLAYRRNTKVELNEECGELKMRLEYLENEFVRKVNETEELTKEIHEVIASNEVNLEKVIVDLKKSYVKFCESIKQPPSKTLINVTGNHMDVIKQLLHSISSISDMVKGEVVEKYELKNELRKARDEAEEIKKSAQDSSNLLNAKISKLYAEREALETDSEANKTKVAKAENELSSLKKEMSNLEERAKSTQRQYENLQQKIIENEEEHILTVNALVTENENLKKELQELEARFMEINESSERLRAEVMDKQSQSEDVQDQNQTFKMDIINMTEENIKLSESKKELEEKWQVTCEERERLKKTINNLNTRLNVITDEKKSMDDVITDLRKQLQKDKSNYEHLLTELKDQSRLKLEDYNLKLKASDEITAQKVAVEQELNKVSDEKDKLEKELEDLKLTQTIYQENLLLELEKVREELEYVKIEYENLVKDNMTRTQKFAEKIVDLENEKLVADDLMRKTETRHLEIAQRQADDIERLKNLLEANEHISKPIEVISLSAASQTNNAKDWHALESTLPHTTFSSCQTEAREFDDNGQRVDVLTQQISRLEMELALKDAHIAQMESKVRLFQKVLEEKQATLTKAMAHAFEVDESSNDHVPPLFTDTGSEERYVQQRHSFPTSSFHDIKRQKDVNLQLEQLYTILHDSDQRMKDTIDEYDNKLEQREAQIAHLKNQMYQRQDELGQIGRKFAFYAQQNFVKSLRDYKSNLMTNLQQNGIMVDRKIEKIINESTASPKNEQFWSGPLGRMGNKGIHQEPTDFNEMTNVSLLANSQISGWEHDTLPLREDDFPNNLTSTPTSPDSSTLPNISRHNTLESPEQYEWMFGKDRFQFGNFRSSRSASNASSSAPPPLFPETSELEYLRKIVYEYMMGHEPLTMAKVISATLKFSEEKQKRILAKEKARLVANSRWI